MRSPAISILIKALATVGLAFGFVVFVAKVPFVPQLPIASDESESRPTAQRGDRAMPRFATGGMPAGGPVATETQAVMVTGDMGTGMGLFKASFAGSESQPGFTTEEHRVPGQCADAGRRYIESECPHCQIIADQDGLELPSVLMWTDPADDRNILRSVSSDCVGIGADGVPVVGVLEFGEPTADLTGGNAAVDSDAVPLLPGATRIAAMEIGPWLAVFDEVARASTALPDMAAALEGRGWRETGDRDAGGLPSFVGERVFTKSSEVFCVISLRKQGGTHQLLTVVSSRARG